MEEALPPPTKVGGFRAKLMKKSVLAEIKEIANIYNIDLKDRRRKSIKVDLDYISVHQKLSEGFVREFADKVNWIYISRYHKLTEGFIREFADKVDWNYISRYQKLSEEFIRKFFNQLDHSLLLKNKNISENIKNLIKVYK